MLQIHKRRETLFVQANERGASSLRAKSNAKSSEICSRLICSRTPSSEKSFNETRMFFARPAQDCCHASKLMARASLRHAAITPCEPVRNTRKSKRDFGPQRDRA